MRDLTWQIPIQQHKSGPSSGPVAAVAVMAGRPSESFVFYDRKLEEIWKRKKEQEI
jgi:hypothetical protein